MSTAAPSADPRTLWSGCYEDLKQLARSRLRTQGPMTLLDTTGLVHQSFLKLVESQKVRLSPENRRQFFAYASSVMRSVIIDLARASQAARRGGDVEVLRMDTGFDVAAPIDDDPEVLHNALQSLAQREPRLAQVVEMRFFGGLTEAEIAEVLELSERTVRQDWVKARVMLRLLLE